MQQVQLSKLRCFLLQLPVCSSQNQMWSDSRAVHHVE